ncbi:hypothetical protein WJX72_000970 [[Myrmecia] bisecta]|uniref:NIF system FeS cluster assembly NifU C-terminal domain-containing protein n=1 Tax=[Myrmecia] bisecta TaxID=41462 RepID=A0AAW1R3Q1_9CHLO
MTDATVPEGHQGLHGFLYGEGGAEAHAAAGGYYVREGEDDGTTLVPTEQYFTARDGEKPLGVYALYDDRRNLQYVGYSRNLVLAVKAHFQRVGEERCAFVRALVFANKAMATRTNLEQEARNWLEDAGTLPPGNGVEKELWEGTAINAAAMSPVELAEYEEKKLKMRKAMGENLADAVEGETLDSAQRRLNLIKAVEGDDWSAVIDGQTAETGPLRTAQAQAAAETIVSPFARASVHRSVGNAEAQPSVALTVAAVDAALEEVRPYLIADGGNVEVADVSNGVVMLRLQGACGTCPSSTATMKMGIERSLRATFGDALKEVMQIDQIDTSASVAAVDEHLNVLRPAIKNYGGMVTVISVEHGVCKVQFEGPPPIGMGVQAAIKDKFPDITKVELV